MEEARTIAESATILSQIILPSQTNLAGTVHGGELMKMMDNCAGACATKHARSIAVPPLLTGSIRTSRACCNGTTVPAYFCFQQTPSREPISSAPFLPVYSHHRLSERIYDGLLYPFNGFIRGNPPYI